MDAATSSGMRVAVICGDTAESLVELVRALPELCGLALVALCPGEPRLAQALAVSSLAVAELRGRTRLERDRVLVVPGDSDAVFQRDELVTSPAAEPRAPLDRLLRSLADEHGARGIAVILGARGNDGLFGIKRLKEAGGLLIARASQDDTGSMPRAAIAAGMVDLVLPLPAIGERLIALTSHLQQDTTLDDQERRAGDPNADSLQDILALIRIRSGHDFGSYKRATLYRRVARRTQVCQCISIEAYHQYLRDHPAELPNLLRDFLISVTSFFRDKVVFEALATQAIPRLFKGKGPSARVRIWVAGCATGEEVYSIGMLLLEHARRMSEVPQIQIFATDIDEEALAEARQGRYPSTIAIDVTPERLQQFFTSDGEYYQVTKELREIVLFSPHNVLRDPPFSRLDLISCRNLMIYLNRDAQDRVLHAFHFGLRIDGLLLLGSSESAENTGLFSAADAKHRLFVRQMTASTPEPSVLAPRWRPPAPAQVPVHAERLTGGELHHLLVERHGPPSVLVNDDFEVVHISERATRLLQITPGEPTRQLLRMIHPALRLELRTALYAARHSERRSDTRIVRYDDAGTSRVLELRVRSVDQSELGPAALLVMFDELDRVAKPAGDEPIDAGLEPVMHHLDEELRRTRDQLRVTIEQYETSLEEVKASNEELHAMNEELRSATEELETSKEELQSVNEELTTLNHELNVKVDEVSQANSDLQNLMTSTDIGVVFLDRALKIKRFTPRAQDLFNVIPSDLGRPFSHLTHRLEADDLMELAQSVLQTLHMTEREVRARNGRRYLARVLPYRSLEDRIEGVVLTFVEVSDLREAVDARRHYQAALQASEQRLQLALRVAPLLVASQDEQLRTTWGYLLGTELPAGSTAVTDLSLSKRAESTLLESDRRKDEFLATLSHELRNPLTPLKVALDIAKLAGSDPQKLQHALGIMDRQLAQLSQLVDDLLDLSRITQGKIEIQRAPIEAASFVESALEATRPLIQQRHHQITVELPTLSRRVLGDHAQLTHVLTNLLNNAAKYTPERGQIQVALQADLAREVLVLRVSDNGNGIAPELLPQVFDLFVQSRDAAGRSKEGLGIGLNLVRRLVELHGGRVLAASDGPGRGSSFTVELPLAPARIDRDSP